MDIANKHTEKEPEPVTPASVSLCVIAYNEEKYLPDLLTDIKAQRWPADKTEIVLVDGGSADRTRRIMLDFAKENRPAYMDIKVLDNPKRIQAAGWNTAVFASRGDVIIRIDAHARIPDDFVSENMRLQKSAEMITGGERPCIAEKDTPWNRTLLLVENSLFGSSIGRKKTKKQYVKTFFHAAYRREVFEKVGGFNEGLVRTEDNELHYRMRRAGYRFCFDPKIHSAQIARTSFPDMIRQKYANGYWIGTTLKICPGCLSLYHLVPAGFVCGIALAAALAVQGIWQLAAAMWGLYGLFAVLSTVIGAMQTKRSASMVLAPVLFLILHVSYGAGTIIGLVKGKEYVPA